MSSLRETILKLSKFRPEKVWVSSLYLHLKPEDRVNGKYMTAFKDMVREKRKDLESWNLPSEVMKSIDEDLRRMEEFLSDPENLKGCRGVAIFSCSGEDFFEAVKLPYIYRNRLMFSPDPLIREILAVEEEIGLVGIALVDRKHVRFFLMDIEGVEERIDLIEPLATRTHRFHSGGGLLKGAEGSFQVRVPPRTTLYQHAYGEWRFHMRIREEWHRILKIASDALFELWKEVRFTGLVIGGMNAGKLREIENHLHTYLREKLIGYIETNPSEATPSEVREKVMDLLWKRDRDQERDLVVKLEELSGKGLAVNGTSKVLEMIAIGNVRTLLVPEDFEKPGYLCSRSHLVSLKPECPHGDDRPLPISDIVDEVIEEALDQKAEVEVVVDKDLQKRIDGLAAFLRFRL